MKRIVNLAPGHPPLTKEQEHAVANVIFPHDDRLCCREEIAPDSYACCRFGRNHPPPHIAIGIGEDEDGNQQEEVYAVWD